MKPNDSPNGPTPDEQSSTASIPRRIWFLELDSIKKIELAFAAALTISTLLTGVFTAGLWWETTRIAKQGDAAYEENRQGLELEHRAWVSVASIAPSKNTNDPKFDYADVTIVNAGKTPATGVTVSIGACYSSYAQLPEYFDTTGVFMNNGSTILSAGATTMFKLPAEKPALLEHRAKQQAGETIYLFLYGSIGYYDVFRKFHVTKFCFRRNADFEPGPYIAVLNRNLVD